jgi:hypothetical protein
MADNNHLASDKKIPHDLPEEKLANHRGYRTGVTVERK